MTIKEIIKNTKWDDVKNIPMVSVVTPYYNSHNTLERTIISLINQSYNDFEYIIVDDGSSILAHDIILPIMQKNIIPMMFISKENGGEHSVYNVAIPRCRGKYVVFLDHDDELKQGALGILLNTWESIPNEVRSEYFEVKGRCVDENGNQVGNKFPDDINEMPYEKAVEIYESCTCEHLGMRDTDKLRRHLLPIPSGVNVADNNLWWYYLRRKYKSYFINDIVRVYHTEISGSLSKQKNSLNLQFLINRSWNAAFIVNHWNWYKSSRYSYLKEIIYYGILEHILYYYMAECPLKIRYKRDKMVLRILDAPCKIGSYIYKFMY